MQCNKTNYIYMRLSNEDDDVGESCSIASQRQCINEFIKNNFVNEKFEEIIDDGYSGTNMSRPGIDRLLKLAEAGQVGTIIVRDLSRFARNYLEAGHYIEFIFPSYDVRFISINDNFDSKNIGEETGGLELAIRNLINQMYSRDISKKIKSSVDMKKLRGEYVYGTAPYGYKKGETKNTIVVDKNAAEVVKKLFLQASEGNTITQIAKYLNEEKIIPPSAYLGEIRGNYKIRSFWTYDSVRNILKNRIYTGDTVPFKSYVVTVGSKKVKSIPSHDQIIIPNTHEAIISRELYFKANEVIKSNKKSKSSGVKNPLTSYLVCGHCGNRLHKGKAGNRNWICTSARYNDDLNCKNVRVDEEKIKAVILRAINNQAKLLDLKIKQSAEKNNQALSEDKVLQTEIKLRKRILENVQVNKMDCYESYVNGNITKEDFLAQKRGMSEQENNLKIELNMLENKLKSITEQKDKDSKIFYEAKVFVKYGDATVLTQELMKELVKKITVYGEDSIYIEWNFMDEIKEILQINITSEVAV